ncbi:MAG: hypothetical protein ACOCUT_01290 [bacterium]
MRKYNIVRKPLDNNRRKYIERIIENLESYTFTPDIVNLMHSFVYLILNDDFNQEIIKIRLNIGIPSNGFISKEEYNNWKTKEKLKELSRRTKEFINNRNLCYERQESIIIEMIKSYILLDDFLPQKQVSLMIKEFSYHRFVGGWDVPDPVLGEQNTKDFGNVFWEVYLYPSDNLTDFKKALQHYYAWMMDFHFRGYLGEGLFEVANKDFIETWNPRHKKDIKITINSEQKKPRITIKFQSYINTKTKEILKEFDKKRKELKELKKNFHQKDNRELMFKRKIKHYILYLEGKSVLEIERSLYNKDAIGGYSPKADSIRTGIKETKRSIDAIMNRRLTL